MLLPFRSYSNQSPSSLQCISLETDLHEAVSMSLADSLRVLLEHGLLEGGEPVPYSGEWSSLIDPFHYDVMGRGGGSRH